MKKLIIIIIAILLIATILPASARKKGQWSFGLNAGIYRPTQENASWAPLITTSAVYWWTPVFSNSLDIGYSFYRADASPKEPEAYFRYMPVMLHSNYHPSRNKDFDPYVTIGTGYSRAWWATGDVNSMSLSSGLGINARFGGSGISVGVEYVIPDVGDFSEGYTLFKLGLGVGGIL